MYGDRELSARVLVFGGRVGVVGASNLEWRAVKGVSTVVAGRGRGVGHGDGITSSRRELG